MLETDPNYPDIKSIRQAMLRREAKFFYQTVRHSPFAHKLEIEDKTDSEVKYIKELLLAHGLVQQKLSGFWEYPYTSGE
jgi:hypothetical protein